jgi:AmpE protein
MTFITILICLALQRFVNLGGIENKWFDFYFDKMQPFMHKFNKWIALLIIILPIFALLGLLHLLLLWRLFGLFYLILASVVLFVSMDARDLRNILNDYFTGFEQHDAQTAANAASLFLAPPVPTNPQDLSRAVTTNILYQSCEKIFVVLFWFIICGIYGAAGYCLIKLTSKISTKIEAQTSHKKAAEYTELSQLATQIKNILDWIPVRLLGFSYALAGNFTNGFAYCLKHFQSNLSDNKKFATESGLTALDIPLDDNSKADTTENSATLDLIDRTLIVWIVAVALISLGMLL